MSFTGGKLKLKGHDTGVSKKKKKKRLSKPEEVDLEAVDKEPDGAPAGKVLTYTGSFTTCICTLFPEVRKSTILCCFRPKLHLCVALGACRSL